MYQVMRDCFSHHCGVPSTRLLDVATALHPTDHFAGYIGRFGTAARVGRSRSAVQATFLGRLPVGVQYVDREMTAAASAEEVACEKQIASGQF